jgi:hypothetical protein
VPGHVLLLPTAILGQGCAGGEVLIACLETRRRQAEADAKSVGVQQCVRAW